jgi:hypothetical protein
MAILNKDSKGYDTNMNRLCLFAMLLVFFPIILFGQYNEVEPNNSMDQANVLTFGDSSVISAEFSPASDNDYFSVEMQDTCMYYLTSIESDENIAPNIALFLQGNAGNILTSSVANRNGNGNFRLSGYVPNNTGLYYAKIFNTENTSGAYKVRLAGGRSYTELLVHEPDDTQVFAATTLALAEADTVYGALYPANDIDYYKISGTEGAQYTIGTTPILDLHPRDTDTIVALYNESGAEIANNDDVGPFDTPSGSVNCTFSQMSGVFPSTGTYYVAVRSYYNVNFGQTISEANPPMGEYGVYFLSGEWQAPHVVARFPHVEMPTLNSILVQWNTVDAQPTYLYWGENENCPNVISTPELVNEHLIKITGLEPESKYYYRAVIDGDTTDAEYFYTAKPPTTEQVRFFVMGDTGSPIPGVASTEDQLAVTDKIMKKKYDFGLHAGDVNQGVGEEYDDIFYTGYKDILKNTSIFTSIGNHDNYHDNAQTYLNSFNLPHNNPDSTERYYSFNYGHAHFIALDTNIPYYPGTAQYEWLQQDLASEMRSQTMWTFVYFHHPPWSEGWPGYPGEISAREYLVPLFEQYHVDMVFNGHTHDYERGLLNGVYYIITGAGGCSLEPGEQYYDHDHVTVRVCEFHFTYIRLNDKSMELTAINKDGTVIDRIVYDKQIISIVDNESDLAGNGNLEDFELFCNYPNPFNHSTLISYRLPHSTHVHIEVYSTLGQKVKTIVREHQEAGYYEIAFDAEELPSGVYIYQIRTENFTQQKKMILMK